MTKGNHPTYSSYGAAAAVAPPPPPHPASAAWCGTRLFLAWVSPLMALAQRKQLGTEDIWPLQPQHQSKVVSAPFTRSFNASRSLPRAFLKSFGWRFVGTGVAFLVALLSSLVGPVALNQVVSSLTSATFSMENVSAWVLALFGSQVLQALVDNYANFESEVIAIEFVGCLKSMLYSKTMRLSSQSRMEKSTGDITNMYTSDSDVILAASLYVHQVWLVPLQILIVSFMLYRVLGVAAFAGIAMIIVMLALNQYVSKQMFSVQRAYRTSKDARMNRVTEVFKAISIVKYNAWEDKMLERIGETRTQELRGLLRYQLFSSASLVLMWGMPVFVCMASFGTYSLLPKGELTPATVFTSLALFQMIQGPLRFITAIIGLMIQSKVALERVTEFLGMAEIDESSVLTSRDPRAGDYIKKNVVVSVEKATFGWDAETTVLRDVNLQVQAGDFYVVHGPVGCGKSSLCSALLGEMIKHSGSVYVGGSVAYCSQQPWVQNMTVRDNILFGQRFDRKKYGKILDACALTKDLETLAAGDMTEIGERGVNLSGGQKARIALARACYSDASIYILDSPLSAVDAIVQNEIFQKCLLSLLRDKTIILVTHSPEIIASEHVTHAVTVDATGALVETRKEVPRPLYQPLVSPLPAHSYATRSYDDVGLALEAGESGVGGDNDALSAYEEGARLNQELALLSPFKETTKMFGVVEGATTDGETTHALTPNSASRTKDAAAAEKGRLIQDESRQDGRVGRHVFTAYYHAAGGFPVVAIIVLSQVVWQFLQVSSDLWLGDWSSGSSVPATESGASASSELSAGYRLGVYSALGLGAALMVLVRTVTVTFFGLRASKSLFDRMTRSLVHAPMSFFDANPIGRILTRYGSDVSMVDMSVASMFGSLFAQVFSIGTSVMTAAVVIQWKGLFLLPVVYLYSRLGSFYIEPAREIERLTRTAQAPVLNHLSESVEGGSVLRAFGRVHLERFKTLNFDKLDDAGKITYAQLCVSRWFSLRIQLLGSALVLIVTSSLVLLHDQLSAVVVGLAFSYALKASQNLGSIVHILTGLENVMVGPERLQEYIDIPQEAAARVPSADPPSHSPWPFAGSITFDHVAFRYKEGGALVLRDLSFTVEGGQKIGIVGRTGAGKSSLTMALFRINELASGKIRIDGVDTSNIGLVTLREKLSIIPQNPVLFKGPLRSYLDPFSAYTDDELWVSIRRVGMTDRISSDEKKLDTAVEENGENFSVGERQMLCIARALLRQSQIVVFDEATAAIDHETDQKLQRVIREAFAASTVLTIAHRLDTILDSDRVLVLERGEMVEYASPAELVKKGSGHFFELMQDGGYLDKFLAASST